MKTFRDLIVWQKALALVTEIYRTTRAFPTEELYGLTAQMRRSSVSIPSNIAEGYGRRSSQELLRFLRIASGSLYELQTQIEVAINLTYLERSAFEGLYESTREIEKMLSSFISKIEAGKAP